jgi:hypothetical protein
MPGPDPGFSSDTFLGRLTGIERDGKTHFAPVSLSPWSRALGTVFCYCGPARRLALRLHARRITPAGSGHVCNPASDLHPGVTL